MMIHNAHHRKSPESIELRHVCPLSAHRASLPKIHSMASHGFVKEILRCVISIARTNKTLASQGLIHIAIRSTTTKWLRPLARVETPFLP